MTTTDNPIIEWWVKYYDILWHYWPVVLLALIIAVWLTVRHFSRRQKEWELNKRDNSPIERDLYEKDVIEIDLNKIKKPSNYENFDQ